MIATPLAVDHLPPSTSSRVEEKHLERGTSLSDLDVGQLFWAETGRSTKAERQKF